MAEKLSVECRAWKDFQSGTLRGFAEIRIAQMRLTIRDVVVHEMNGKRWAQMPAKAQINKDKELIKDRDGKIQYAKILDFDNKDVADAFSAAVLRAVDEFTGQR
jgi:hypothetical protein